MKKFFAIMLEITLDIIFAIISFITNNLMNFARILTLIVPYLMYFIGKYVMITRGNNSIGGEILIPLIFIIVIYYLKSSANKLGKGITVPLPNKRFTEVSEDGEVSIENDRIQELLLYIADLEDWLERKGLI